MPGFRSLARKQLENALKGIRGMESTERRRTHPKGQIAWKRDFPCPSAAMSSNVGWSVGYGLAVVDRQSNVGNESSETGRNQWAFNGSRLFPQRESAANFIVRIAAAIFGVFPSNWSCFLVSAVLQTSPLHVDDQRHVLTHDVGCAFASAQADAQGRTLFLWHWEV